MKSLVVDASVAAKWVVEEAHSAAAARLLDCDSMHAPDHWLAEAANVLWSKVLKGDLEARDAGERMTALTRAPVTGAPVAGLLPRAWPIAVGHSVTIYDALYVALAVVRAVPLVTADEKLVRRFRGTEFSDSVLWIGEAG